MKLKQLSICHHLSNCHYRIVRKVVAADDIAVLNDEEVIDNLKDLFKAFHGAGKDISSEVCKKILLQTRGFLIERKPSLMQNAGHGVFVTKGCIMKGSMVAFYPGK